MTRPHQFLHESVYGRSPTKRAKGHECISGITAEAARVPGTCSHVDHPLPPSVLYGVSPLDVGEIAIERSKQARDAAGRRLRRDGAALLATVISYPVEWKILKANADAMAFYRSWRNDTCAWLKAEFGTALESIVEHTDELFPHLHAFAIPELGPDNRLQWEKIHAGRAALLSLAQGASKGEQRRAYIAAMKNLQDRFHAEVSAQHGHERLGPRRRRLDRAEAKRASASRVAEAKRKAEMEEELGRRTRAFLRDARLRLQEPLQTLKAELEEAQMAQAEDQKRIEEQAMAIERLTNLLREHGIELDGLRQLTPH